MGIQTIKFENNTKHLADLKNDPCPKRFCTFSVVNGRLQTLDDIIQLSDNRTKSFSFHLILTKKKMKVEKFNSTLITFGKLVLLFSLQMKIVKLKGLTVQGH